MPVIRASCLNPAPWSVVMGTGSWVWVPVFMAIFFNSLGSGQNVTVTNSPDPIVIQALGSVASLVEEPCAPEKKMENGSHSASVFSSGF